MGAGRPFLQTVKCGERRIAPVGRAISLRERHERNPGDYECRRCEVMHLTWVGGHRLPSDGSDVENDRHWAVVHERNVHSRSEHTRLHRYALSAQRLTEALVERLRDLWTSRLREVGPSSLLVSAIRDERELADDERVAADVDQRAVETVGLVPEDPEPRDLSSKPEGFVLSVLPGDPEQDQEAVSALPDDLATDRDRGPSDPLNNGAHAVILT
jgi:hypothetical protein